MHDIVLVIVGLKFLYNLVVLEAIFGLPSIGYHMQEMDNQLHVKLSIIGSLIDVELPEQSLR